MGKAVAVRKVEELVIAIVAANEGLEPIDRARAILRECLSHGDDVVTAAELAVPRLLADHALIADCLPHWLRSWAIYEGSQIASRSRRTIERLSGVTRVSPQVSRYSEGRSTEIALAMAEPDTDRLMSWPMPSGKTLAKSTATEVREAAEHKAKKANTAAQRGRWFAAIADATEKNAEGDHSTVGETLTENTLHRLWEESVDGD